MRFLALPIHVLTLVKSRLRTARQLSVQTSMSLNCARLPRQGLMVTTPQSEVVVNSFFPRKKNQTNTKRHWLSCKKVYNFAIFSRRFLGGISRLPPYTRFLRPNRRNELVLKINGSLADCKMRPAGASIANDLAGRAVPVFLMRDLARQG